MPRQENAGGRKTAKNRDTKTGTSAARRRNRHDTDCSWCEYLRSLSAPRSSREHLFYEEQADEDCGIATFVEPSPELLARWAQEDARYGEPVSRAELEKITAQHLSDFELVEYIAQCEQEASRARARELIAVHVLAQRDSMNPFWPVRVGTPCIAGEEIAIRLGASRSTGRELVEAAELFAGPLMATADAL